MYNSNEDHTGTNNPSSKTEDICKRLRILMYCLFGLVCMRIVSSQILWMISDLMSALIVYCTYTSKGKITALFCFINGIMSAFYAVIVGVEYFSHEDKSKLTIKRNPDQKSDYNFSDNEYGMAKQPNISFMPYVVAFTLIFALIIYGLISYSSYQAIKFFRSPFGNIGDEQGEDGRLIDENRGYNYGAVNNGSGGNQGNNWNGQSYRNNGYGLSSTQNNNGSRNRVVPFAGRGTVLGGA